MSEARMRLGMRLRGSSRLAAPRRGKVPRRAKSAWGEVVIGVPRTTIRGYTVLRRGPGAVRRVVGRAVIALALGSLVLVGCDSTSARAPVSLPVPKAGEIGRASCRERVFRVV